MTPPMSPTANVFRHTLQRSISRMSGQAIYIVTAIHCPSLEDMNPLCYTITGAFASPAAAQTAMRAKAQEMRNEAMTHTHDHMESESPEWREEESKIQFRKGKGDFGLVWIDERRVGAEEMPITKHLEVGRGLWERKELVDEDAEAEKTLCSLLKF
jgi:hypothetical protein